MGNTCEELVRVIPSAGEPVLIAPCHPGTGWGTAEQKAVTQCTPTAKLQAFCNVILNMVFQ